MKIRHGFVSNSSSSSFVIARGEIGNDKFDALKKHLNENEIDFSGNANYLFVDTSYQSVDKDFLTEIGITDNQYYQWSD